MTIALNNHNQRYFPEIDGLRAVAVLAVMLFHLNPSTLSGGYIGVDVFFVISGFVVTRSIVHDQDKPFSEFISAFYAWRFLRIVPALLVMLITTVLVSIALIPDAWLSDALQQTALYAFAGLSNFSLITTNDGYFAPRSEFNPFIHTWSLAVEVQFYLLFPLMLYLFCCKQRQRSYLRYVLPVLCIASLIWSAWITHINPGKAYYMLPSRFWELGLGAWACLVGPESRQRFINLLGCARAAKLGIALVALAAICADSSAFPFPWAIPAVLGALLLILCATMEGPKGLVEKILGSHLLVGIGLLSYSLYLWHWPVYTLMRWTTGLYGIKYAAIALALTFVLSWISWRFIETPTRRLPNRIPIPASAIIACGLLFMAVGWFASYQAYEHSADLKLTVVEANRRDWYPTGPSVLAEREMPCTTRWQTLSEGVVDIVPQGCTSGSHLPTHRIFVGGDSHASAYDRMLDGTVRALGQRITRFSSAGCAIANLTHPQAASSSSCQQFQRQFIDYVLRESHPGDIVFLPGLRIDRLDRSSQVAAQSKNFAFVQQWQDYRVAEQEAKDLITHLTDKGLQVIIELPKPVYPSPPYRCADSFNRNNPVCAAGFTVNREFMEHYRSPIVEMARRIQAGNNKVILWDPLNILCGPQTCQAFARGKPLYFDGDHLSGYGNQVLIPSFIFAISDTLEVANPLEKLGLADNTCFGVPVGLLYTSTLAEGIDFRRNGYPNFIARVDGLSNREDWGRWSDDNLGPIQLKFSQALPDRFIVALTARAIGPNESKPVTVKVGKSHQTFSVGYEPKTFYLEFNNMEHSDCIELFAPQPVSARQINPGGNDYRILGIGLVSLKILSP